MSIVRVIGGLSTAGTALALATGFALLGPDVDPPLAWDARPALGSDTHMAPTRDATVAQDMNAPYDGKYHFTRVQYSTGGRGSFGGGSRTASPYTAPSWASNTSGR